MIPSPRIPEIHGDWGAWEDKEATMHATETPFPKRMNPLTMQSIARAYHVGANPKEIAAEHDITVHAVIAIARRYDAQRRTVKRVRQVISRPPPITPPEPTRIDRSGEFYVVHRDGLAINLPMLSILRD